MVENDEVGERLDLDDNCMEEEDDDVEDGGGDGNGEGNDVEVYGDSKSGVEDGKDQSTEVERNDVDTEHVEDEEKSMASVSEEDKEKHAQLLALPPNGSEVFIGGLPKDASEADLADLCETIGEIYEIRLVKDKESGESKGYAFVSFKSEEVAQKAIEDLHSKQFKGKTIRCSLTETKNVLFVGNIPKSWTEDEFRKAIEARILECRCQPHVLEELIGAIGQVDRQVEVEVVVAVTIATVVENIDPISFCRSVETFSLLEQDTYSSRMTGFADKK